jgi:hypothetical protein
MLKSQEVGGADHVASMREMRDSTKFWSENLWGRYHLDDLGVDGIIILK